MGSSEKGFPGPTVVGASAMVEHALVRDRVRLWSLDVGAVVLPDVAHDVYWQVPIGVGVRFW